MSLLRKQFSFSYLLEGITFIVLTLSILYSIISGNYLKLVAPKTLPYLIFSIIVSSVWGITSIVSAFKAPKSKRKKYWLFLLIPIIFIHLPSIGANLDYNYWGRNLTFYTVTAESSAITEDVTSKSNVSSKSESASTQPRQTLTVINGLDREQKNITIEDAYFYSWLNRIYQSPYDYLGYQIEITGFVFDDPAYFSEGTFLIARLAMTCCIADLTPLGFVCQTTSDIDAKTGQWYTVKGEIVLGEYKGSTEPQIKIISVLPVEPIDEYIYLN